MCTMSRKSKSEYIAEKRRAHDKTGKPKRSRILDDVCETLGYTHKYAIKLLTGTVRYREHKGHRRTYNTCTLENARRRKPTAGAMCTNTRTRPKIAIPCTETDPG